MKITRYLEFCPVGRGQVNFQVEQLYPHEVMCQGTVERSLSEGLKKGNRHYVHLSKDVETTRKVGARRGKPMILKVDAGRMHRDGHKF